jgi:MoaA/NifB/PqqE/SkfB family radical SAM enzyme
VNAVTPSEDQNPSDETIPDVRLDTRPAPESAPEPLSLPEPVFPLHTRRREWEMGDLVYHLVSGVRAVRCWVVPYLRSRIFERQFRPLLAFLFTELRCNLGCHYCWAFDNHTPGMSADTARRSIDWLHALGCRVLALMGGEPLLRPRFVHQVTYYGARKGFFVYVPTNGRTMTPEVIDRLGDAGVAVINLAVDCVDEIPGLPKALSRIRPHFDYLVRRQRHYGYLVVFNINITHLNIDDVRALTEIAYENGISTDYHINEPPPMAHRQAHPFDDNSTYLGPDDFARVDELLDYLIECNRRGYIMVNSKNHLAAMKAFMRGTLPAWPCRAGRNTLIIRVDGTLAPCFGMYSATHDWGRVGDPRFAGDQLDQMRTECSRNCLSTCNYMAGNYYSDTRMLRWVGKQLAHGYQGVKHRVGVT